MKIENGVLVLESGLKCKSIGMKSVKIGEEIKQLEVYKEDIEEQRDKLQVFKYFSYDKDTNKLYELTFDISMDLKEDNFISSITYSY